MVNSRDINQLLPQVRDRVEQMLVNIENDPWFINADITITVTSTFRDFESQNALYASGRTIKGRTKTNAKGGESWHNWRRAADVCLFRSGKPIWGTGGHGINADPTDDDTNDLEAWQRFGQHAAHVGLEWAGNWKKFKEFPHVQLTEGLSWRTLLAQHPNGI